MEIEETRIDAFKRHVCILHSLFEEISSEEQRVAVDYLKMLQTNCEKKTGIINNSENGPSENNQALVQQLQQLQQELEQVIREKAELQQSAEVREAAEGAAVEQLRIELEQLKKENSDLQAEVTKLNDDIQEANSPHNVARSIIDGILDAVVPPEPPKKRGRPRKGNPKRLPVDSYERPMRPIIQDAKPLSLLPPSEKRGRGRPRKYADHEIVMDYNERKRKHEDKEDGPMKMLRPDEIKQEDEGESSGRQLRPLRQRLMTESGSDSEGALEDDDNFDINDLGDMDFDDESMGVVKKKPPSIYKPKAKLRGVMKRKRGRPRKNQYRDTYRPVKRHKKIVRHVCQICNAQFIHGRPFHRHLSEKHEEGGTSCIHCRKEFENYAHFLHHKCEAGKPGRACKVCNENFKTFRLLREHVQEVHGLTEIDPLYVCKYCQQGFMKRSALIEHLFSHADGKQVCEKCGEFADNQDELEKHEEIHKGSATGNLYCDRCSASFDKRQQYESHLANHEKYDCSICNSAFSQKKQLLKHVRSFHGIKISVEAKKYECDECPRSFSRPGQLEIHKRVHTGERPIECNVCKIFFKSKKALYKHNQTHSHLTRVGAVPLERSHLCAICGRSYFRKQALQRHMLYHDNAKHFKCPHCDYECRDPNNLKRHVNLHFSNRQFVCEICGAAFHAKKTLETHHLYKHADDRPHKCLDCPMTFKTPNSLRRHSLIHATERPYKCQACSMGFNRLYNLRRHMKGVHGSDEVLPAVHRVKLLDVPEGQEFAKGNSIHTKPRKRNSIPEKDLFNKTRPDMKPFLPPKEEISNHSLASQVTNPEQPQDLVQRAPVPLTIPQVMAHGQPGASHPMYMAAAQVAAQFASAGAGGGDDSSGMDMQTLTTINPLHLSQQYLGPPGRFVAAHLPHIPPATTSPSPVTSAARLPPQNTTGHTSHSHSQHHSLHLQPQHHHSQPQQGQPPQPQPAHDQQQQQQQQQQQMQLMSNPPYPGEIYNPVGNILHLINNGN